MPPLPPNVTSVTAFACLQVIFALPAENGTDYTMRIYNSDGSEPEMCGNGIRCLARFVADVDGAEPRMYKVHTLAGLIQPSLLPDGQVLPCIHDHPDVLQESFIHL